MVDPDSSQHLAYTSAAITADTRDAGAIVSVSPHVAVWQAWGDMAPDTTRTTTGNALPSSDQPADHHDTNGLHQPDRTTSASLDEPEGNMFHSRAKRRSSDLGDILRGRLKTAGSIINLSRISPAAPDLLDPLSQAARELLNSRSIGSDGCTFTSALDEVLAAQEAQDLALRPAAEELYGRQRLHFSGACRNPVRSAVLRCHIEQRVMG